MGRNSGDYVLYPKNIGDALYAAVNPSGSNRFITADELDAAIGLNNELSEVLANGNTTGGNNIVMTLNDVITSAAGGNQIELTSTSIEITTDAGAFGEGQFYMDATSIDLGIATSLLKIRSTSIAMEAPSGNQIAVDATSAAINDGSIDVFNATAGSTLIQGSVDVGITSPIINFTVTNLRLGLTEYANNAAATGAGLAAGDYFILQATQAVTRVV